MSTQKDPLFPRNRKEVFVDLIFRHKSELIKSNLWAMLFAAPSLILVYAYYLFSGYLSTLIEKGLWSLPIENGEVMSQYLYLFQVRNVLFAVLILTNILLFAGLGGLFGNVQELCFMKNNGAPLSFFGSFKRNARDFILCSFLFSGACFFVNLVISFYGQDLSSWIAVVSISIASLVIVFVLWLLFLALPLFNLYKGKFFGICGVSYLLFFKKFFSNVGLWILSLLPLLAYLIPSTIFTSIFSILIVLLYFPYLSIISILDMNRLADSFINGGRFPELVNKGLDLPSKE